MVDPDNLSDYTEYKFGELDTTVFSEAANPEFSGNGIISNFSFALINGVLSLVGVAKYSWLNGDEGTWDELKQNKNGIVSFNLTTGVGQWLSLTQEQNPETTGEGTIWERFYVGGGSVMTNYFGGQVWDA